MTKLELDFATIERLAELAEDAGLEATESEKLLNVCKSIGLNAEESSDINFIALVLRDFELHGKQLLKTPVERRKGIEEVERLSIALHQALRTLEQPDLEELEWHMPDDDLQTRACIECEGSSFSSVFGFAIDDALVRAAMPELPAGKITFRTVYAQYRGRAYHLAMEAERLGQAAKKLRNLIGVKVRSAGPKNTLRHYAWFVEKIADHIDTASIRVGRGGSFERLCEAVWNAAKVHSSPAGAIREMIRLRALKQDEPDDLPF